MSSFFIPPDLMALARLSSMASGELGAQPPTISFKDLTSPQPGSFSLSRAWCILTGTMTSFFVILGLSQALSIASLTAALVSSFSAPRFFIDCATWKGFAPFLAKVLRIINNFALFSGDTPHAAIALCARTIAVKSFGCIFLAKGFHQQLCFGKNFFFTEPTGSQFHLHYIHHLLCASSGIDERTCRHEGSHHGRVYLLIHVGDQQLCQPVANVRVTTTTCCS